MSVKVSGEYMSWNKNTLTLQATMFTRVVQLCNSLVGSRLVICVNRIQFG